MNSFAALVIDSDDEENPKVSANKKTTTAKGKGSAGAKSAAKSAAPARVIPGMKPKAAPAATPAAPELEAEDPTLVKVNDRGGRNREKYNGHSQPKGSVPNDKRAHKDRHDYSRTPRGGGKEGVRGGRGPGGWGSHEEEAQRAAKNPEEALDESVPADEPEEESQAEETGPAVMGLDEFMARRDAERANNKLFGQAKERTVAVDSSLKVVKREANPEDQVEATKSNKKTQRTKVAMEAGYKVASGNEYVPRERTSEGARSAGRGGRGGRGDRDGRGRGGRGNRGSGNSLNAEDFPAL